MSTIATVVSTVVSTVSPAGVSGLSATPRRRAWRHRRGPSPRPAPWMSSGRRAGRTARERRGPPGTAPRVPCAGPRPRGRQRGRREARPRPPATVPASGRSWPGTWAAFWAGTANPPPSLLPVIRTLPELWRVRVLHPNVGRTALFRGRLGQITDYCRPVPTTILPSGETSSIRTVGQGRGTLRWRPSDHPRASGSRLRTSCRRAWTSQRQPGSASRPSRDPSAGT